MPLLIRWLTGGGGILIDDDVDDVDDVGVSYGILKPTGAKFTCGIVDIGGGIGYLTPMLFG
jgi:hypothetical protein